MKKILFAFFVVSAFFAKADTIDVWHVYYNGQKIQDFNGYGFNEILLKAETIKVSDSITVEYFRDTPCYDCPTSVFVQDEKHYIISMDKGKGTSNPISFSLVNLIKSGKSSFEVYYFEEGGMIRKTLIFRIKIE